MGFESISCGFVLNRLGLEEAAVLLLVNVLLLGDRLL